MATQTKLLTYDDYRRLPDDGNQYQIIEGRLIMAPSPKMIHQLILGKLYRLAGDYVEEKNLGTVIISPADLVLSMRNVVQPDMMFISEKRSPIISENNVVEAPDFVVEILSEGTRIKDRTSKKDLYQRFGVREYWIIDPVEKSIEPFILRDQTFQSAEIITTSQQLTSETIKDFTLQANTLFPDQ